MSAKTASSTETQTEPPVSIRTTIERLRPFFNEIQAIVDEVKVHATEQTLDVRAVDPANVAMADSSLKTTAFDTYQFNADGNHTLGLDIEQFTEVLSQGSPSDSLHLEVDAKTRKLNITIDESLEFSLALIDPDSIRQEPDIPDLDLPAHIELEADKLNRGVTAADMVSDHVKMGVTGDESTFFLAADGDTDDVRDELTEGNGLETLEADLSSTADEVHGGENGDSEKVQALEERAISSMFSLDYLKDFRSAMNSNDTLTLKLGDEFPIKIHIDKAEIDYIDSMLMLAPRIEAD